MNVEAKSRPVNWRKFIWVGLILLVAGYTYGRPTLEKWTGLDLPSLSGENEPGARNSSSTAEYDYSVDFPGDSKESDSSEAATSSTTPSLTRPSTRFELNKIGRNKFESPAGLVYTMGPSGEHRIEHVMRHGKDNPGRPVHSVFEGDRDKILALIDEAYGLIKSNSKRVKTSREGNRTEYTVDMQKTIGFEGGQKGKRNGFPALKRMKLILQNETNVITAYPYR